MQTFLPLSDFHADEKLEAALHEASVYGIGATSDYNQRIILEAAKRLASPPRTEAAGEREDELQRNSAIAGRLRSFHRNSCYPEASDTEVANCVIDILALASRPAPSVGEEEISLALCKRRNTAQCAALCLQHSSVVNSHKCPEAKHVFGADARAVLALLSAPSKTDEKP